MATLSEQVGAIKTIVEKFLNDPIYLKPNTINQLDGFVNTDHLPIDLSQTNLQLAISANEAIIDNLRFEDDELRRNCEQLSQKLKQCVAQRDAQLLEKETTKKGHQLRLRAAKAKLSVYEKFMKTKFTINKDSVTAFIFNPDSMVQLNLSEALTNTDTCQMIDPLEKNVTKPVLSDNEIKQMKSLWDRMEVSEKWKHLIDRG
ncbi:unnamed protein product [Schistosoma turkestanicum]|nr:unnamed protein product [Schistosoma turkestanicum]